MFTVEFKIFGNNVKSLKYVVILLICIIVREKCPYSQFIWSLFFRIRTEYEPGKLRIRKLFMQCQWLVKG